MTHLLILLLVGCVAQVSTVALDHTPESVVRGLDTMGDALKPPRRVGLVGLGAIGSVVAQHLLMKSAQHFDNNIGGGVDGATLAAVLVTDTAKHQDKREWLPESVLLTDESEQFFSASLSVIVEASGQPWVVENGERALRSGSDLLVTSTGAFTDPMLKQALCHTAACVGSGRLLLASGAMPAVDWMQAASVNGGAERVALKQSKPPASWVGTAAEDKVKAVKDWEQEGAVVLFEGSAREAAAAFPRSSNVAATLGLATAGLEKTQVQLVADPSAAFKTRVELRAACGSIVVDAEHLASATNARTSRDVALSVLRSLRAVCSPAYAGI